EKANQISLFARFESNRKYARKTKDGLWKFDCINVRQIAGFFILEDIIFFPHLLIIRSNQPNKVISQVSVEKDIHWGRTYIFVEVYTSSDVPPRLAHALLTLTYAKRCAFSAGTRASMYKIICMDCGTICVGKKL
ncbi:hypothetical protein L9F63_004886, partial [Diploptera punctata]